MNFPGVFFATFLVTLASAAHATQTAQATFFCLSLRFEPGTNSANDSKLDLSTLPGPPNGELGTWFVIYSHRSLFSLDRMGFPINGTLYLDVPQIPDANTNGFDDNFEVRQAVTGTSYGEYTTGLGGGTITATWTRPAGSKDGTCRLHLVDDVQGNLGFYWHAFELLELKGPFTYTPGSNTVPASVNLTNATRQLEGPASFTKSAANPSNQLTLAAGTWTNAAQQSFTHPGGSFYRYAPWPTNYFGNLNFDDGEPATGGADYRRWVLSIDDLNDSDHDGIPDFSDDPVWVAPRRPALSLAFGNTNLLLTLSGDVNRLHHILESTNLFTGYWKTKLSLTLTNDPQTVSLPLPAGRVQFWRALAE